MEENYITFNICYCEKCRNENVNTYNKLNNITKRKLKDLDIFKNHPLVLKNINDDVNIKITNMMINLNEKFLSWCDSSFQKINIFIDNYLDKYGDLELKTSGFATK